VTIEHVEHHDTTPPRRVFWRRVAICIAVLASVAMICTVVGLAFLQSVAQSL